MATLRILFSSDDFKTHHWGKELEIAGCEIVLNRKPRSKALTNIVRHAAILFSGFINRKKIHVFVFRYLNDNRHLRVCIEFLIRDLLTILLCKLTNVKVIWLKHNINRETIQHYPFIINVRRFLIQLAAQRVLVTDPQLISIALRYGSKENRLDWICFGRPDRMVPDQKNIELRNRIADFKERIHSKGIKNMITGLCVSSNSAKSAHFLYADAIVGMNRAHSDTCVVLVIIAEYPEGEDFRQAKIRAEASPWILLIDTPFPVNENLIADQIDFIYRSMTDYSIAYTLYVACDIKKPVITHKLGALGDIVVNEKIGIAIQPDQTDIPSLIHNCVETWDPSNADRFLAVRNWETGAARLLDNIHKAGVKTK